MALSINFNSDYASKSFLPQICNSTEYQPITEQKRTSIRQKAKQLAKFLREENPDYDYLRELFRHLRVELMEVNTCLNHHGKTLPCLRIYPYN
ncbi:hypothetical protein LDG_9096 [Legionella drancourtii LLAP12]|uniref:Uncharacterized protein n=1 Tax=Legionella drancourtii LLAP12 TaxID=658187 RepID=G9EUU6_9GAMM|nr:hypothetical protein LDG_9096 [Legionella drancourtii LLAP12]